MPRVLDHSFHLNIRIQTMTGVLDQTFQRKTMTDQQGSAGVLDHAFQLHIRTETMTEVPDRTYQFGSWPYIPAQ